MQRDPALIFDFGNVIAHFDYRKAGERLGRKLGLSGDSFLERARALGFTPLAQSYERGELTSEAFGLALCRALSMEMTHEEFVAAWSDIFRLNEPVAELVAFLKGRGYTLVLGSNTNDMHAAHFRRQFAETLRHFDRLVLSHEIGHIKPTAPFYLACAEAAGRPPRECVFIDDLAENIEGARSVGLVGLLYRDDTTLAADLRRLGVDVPD